MKQFSNLDDTPPLYYALAVLHLDKWVDFLVVSRARLQSYHNGPHKFGSYNRANNALEITVEFREEVKCSGQVLTDCRNAWKSLPPLLPRADLAQAAQPRVKDQVTATPDDAANEPPDSPNQA
jgi:hypothetical protein